MIEEGIALAVEDWLEEEGLALRLALEEGLGLDN